MSGHHTNNDTGVSMHRTILTVLALILALGLSSVTPTAKATERPAWPDRSEQASHCPFCVAAGFTAIRVLKAAKTVKKVSKAKKAAAAARAAAAAQRVQRNFDKLLVTVRREAATISSRGSGFARRNWPKFRRETQACLFTAATLGSYKYVKDGRLDYKEYTDWYYNMPPGVFTTEPFPPSVVKFPVYVAKDAVLDNPDEFALECGIGVAVQKSTFGRIPPPA